MKSYKEFEQKYIGYSDIATLILAGIRIDQGLCLEKLSFGEDNNYYAYIVNENDAEIGSHYKKVCEFDHWLKIYDDDGLVCEFKSDKIIIYRAGEMGCIVHLTGNKEHTMIYYK